MVDFPAHVLHEHEEVARVVGVLNGRPQVRLQHGAEGGLALALPQLFDVTDGLGGLVLHNYGQSMLPAQPIRDCSNLAVVSLIGNVIFFPDLCVHGIEQQVGMDVLFVYMRTDGHLIIRQVLSRKFCGDFQRQLWGNFSRLEGLDNVITLASIQFSKGTVGVHHLLVLQSGVAILMIGQNLAVGLISIQHIEYPSNLSDYDSHRPPHRQRWSCSFPKREFATSLDAWDYPAIKRYEGGAFAR